MGNQIVGARDFNPLGFLLLRYSVVCMRDDPKVLIVAL